MYHIHTKSHLRVQRQRTARPIHHNHIQFTDIQQLILHLRYPAGQRRIDETVYDQCGRAFRAKVRFRNRVAVGGHNHLRLARILLRVQQKARVDDAARQWEHVERPVDEVVPVARYVQAADLTEASGLVFI